MTKVWLLATQTYRQHLRSGSFLILTFALPVLMIIAGAVPVFSMINDDLTRLGYVDLTGQLPVPAGQLEDTDLGLSIYRNVEAAHSALTQDTIDGYLVVPADYFQQQPPVFYGREEPGPLLQETLTQLLRRAMLSEQPAWIAKRLADPSQLTYVARATGQEVAAGPGVLIYVIIPAVLAIIFALTVLTGAGQMGAAMVREKDQRAMEIVITSIAPWQLVSGKVLGITLLTITQLAIWAVGAGIALGLLFLTTGGQPITLPWAALFWAVLLCGPGYLLYAVLAAGLGLIAGDQQQARQFAGLLGFVGLAPLYFMGALVNAINGPLALILTWFPLTAPVVALFRIALSQVPIWQLIISFVILLASLLAALWFVAVIFRSAILLYGQALRPKQIWQILQQAGKGR